MIHTHKLFSPYYCTEFAATSCSWNWFALFHSHVRLNVMQWCDCVSVRLQSRLPCVGCGPPVADAQQLPAAAATACLRQSPLLLRLSLARRQPKTPAASSVTPYSVQTLAAQSHAT